MLVGLLVFISGMSVMLFESYGESGFKIDRLEEIIILVVLISSGLIIIGIGLMLEFTRRKYGMRK